MITTVRTSRGLSTAKRLACIPHPIVVRTTNIKVNQYSYKGNGMLELLSLGTPFGLAFASGLNAYLPLLLFTISVRWLHLSNIDPHFTFATSNWCMIALTLLTLLDFVAEKIPLLDHGWDAIHTFIRPFTGAVIAGAAGGTFLSGLPSNILSSSQGSEKAIMTLSTLPAPAIGLFVLLLLGGALAFLSHTAKSTTRLFSTIATAGILNIGLSVAEDIIVLLLVLLSLFASAVMFLVLVVLLIFLAPPLIRLWTSRFRKRKGFLL
jgi:Domain of unknown function (DUF4126)